MLLITLSSSAATWGWWQEPSVEDEGAAFVESFVENVRPAKKTELDSDRDPGESAADREPAEDSETAEDRAEALKKFVPEVVDEIPDQAKETREPERESKPKYPPHLEADMQRLKWKVREVLAWHFDHPQKVTERSPWGIMHAMLPLGVDSQIIDANGRRQNAVGYLCYNYSARGQRLFYLKNGRIQADIGPGLQGHRGQFLAMLAQSKVDPSYPMRIDGKMFKVADLIEYEKVTCEAGTELTFKLIAFSHYLPHDAKWKNERGEDWDFTRLIREELKQPVVGAACGGTHRMTGFSYASNLHVKRKLPMEGQWLRADRYVDSYLDYITTLQNRDGSFSTNWFASRGDLPNLGRKLQTGGHMLEWLVYTLPEERLSDPQVIRGVDFIAHTLMDGFTKNNPPTKWEIGPLGHALHALALYDERMFGGKPGQRVAQLSKENRPQPKTIKN
jgi:hypothetical protein